MTTGQTDPDASSTLSYIPLQARRDLRKAYSYLLATERADYYQAIVRVFLRRSRLSYTTYLRVDEVWSELARLYPDYTLDRCKGDMEQLCEWRNLAKTYDVDQRHETIDSFLHPTVLYRATPETLEIEEGFLRIEQRTDTMGELRRSDLEQLLRLFMEVDKLLHADTPDVSQAIAETWRRLADQASMILKDTSRFMEALEIFRQEAAISDIEGYLRYKEYVVRYIQSYAIELTRVSEKIRERVARWERRGEFGRIRAALAAYIADVYAQQSRGSGFFADDEWSPVEEADRMIQAVVGWVEGHRWSDYFDQRANFEILSLVTRASVLSLTLNMKAGYINDLENLAARLLITEDREQAAQIFATGFAYDVPRILPDRQLADSTATNSDRWTGDPVLVVELRPIQRTNSFVQGDDSSILEDADWIAEQETVDQALVQHRLECLERLFGLGERDVTQMDLTDDEDARFVCEVHHFCLSSPTFQWQAEDGSRVTLLNPDAEALARVYTPDSIYFLPRYQFRRAIEGAVPVKESVDASTR